MINYVESIMYIVALHSTNFGSMASIIIQRKIIENAITLLESLYDETLGEILKTRDGLYITIS